MYSLVRMRRFVCSVNACHGCSLIGVCGFCHFNWNIVYSYRSFFNGLNPIQWKLDELLFSRFLWNGSNWYTSNLIKNLYDTKNFFRFPIFVCIQRQTISDSEINFRNHNNALTCLCIKHTRCSSTICGCMFLCFAKEFYWGWKTLSKEKLANKRLISFFLAKTL